MERGFLYLVAKMDWYSRKVLSWRLSNTLEADFCVAALKQAKVQISMDGKGRYLDNIFIERLWRTLKYECVYLHAWETGSQARAGVRNWMEFYNNRRPHKALGGRPPAVVYSLKVEATQPDQQEQIRA